MGRDICSQLAAERARVELELQELGANYGGVVEAASVRARLQQLAADPERPHIPLRRRPLVEQHQGRVTARCRPWSCPLKARHVAVGWGPLHAPQTTMVAVEALRWVCDARHRPVQNSCSANTSRISRNTCTDAHPRGKALGTTRYLTLSQAPRCRKRLPTVRLHL